MQRNEATRSLKANWARKVSQGCMINRLSSRVLEFKGVEEAQFKDKVHKGEVRIRDDWENVVWVGGNRKDIS